MEVPYSKPSINDDEINEVVDTLKSGWLTTGPKVARFEKDFKEYIGVDHALAVSSATAGLHLALEAVGIKEGHKVVVPVHTFTATAEVVRYLGADPVFVDVDPDTLNIDVIQLERMLLDSPDIKAIIPVHFAGQACSMDMIMSLARRHGCKVIEDAAHALPTTHNKQLIGTIADLTVFSFYANKNITTGEGGMVVTNNKDYADRIKIMRLHGISTDAFDRYSSDKPKWYYEVIAPGYKYNMTDIAASIGIHQLKKSDKFCRMRNRISSTYTQLLQNLPLITPVTKFKSDKHAWHLYVIRLELDKLTINRDEVIELLASMGVSTSVHFIPLHKHPYWKSKYNCKDTDYPVSTKAFHQSISLPIYPTMELEQVTWVAACLKTVLTKHQK